jgi:hypothetical protein
VEVVCSQKSKAESKKLEFNTTQTYPKQPKNIPSKFIPSQMSDSTGGPSTQPLPKLCKRFIDSAAGKIMHTLARDKLTKSGLPASADADGALSMDDFEASSSAFS